MSDALERYRRRRSIRPPWALFTVLLIAAAYFAGYCTRDFVQALRHPAKAHYTRAELEDGLDEILRGNIGSADDQELVSALIAGEKSFRVIAPAAADKYHEIALAYVEHVLRTSR